MAGEIAVGGFGALGSDRLGAGCIGGEQGLRRIVGPLVHQSEQGFYPIQLRERQEHPASFLAPLEHSGVGQDLEVAGNARLALTKHLGKLPDRQLHQPQKRDDPQPSRVGKRLESVGQRHGQRHGIRI